MNRILAALAAMSLLVACSPPPTQNTNAQQFEQAQKSVTPKGSVVVRVIDGAMQTPLDGVTVKALGTDTVGTTNADGIFRFDGLTVNSSYQFIFDKAGFVRNRQNASISGTAGNSPLEGAVTTFTIELYPATGTITGHIFLPNGTPAGGANLYVDQRNVGESVVTAVAGMDGAFTITGLASRPSGQSHTVYARWFDENGDMQADYAGFQSFVTVYPGTPARVFMTYSTGTQRIIASNISDGEVASGEDLQFTFAMPLFTGSLQGSGATPWVLTQTSAPGSPIIPVEGTFMSPTQLRIRPALNSLRDGQLYRLVLTLRNATASGTGTTFSSGNIDFQVRPANVMPYTTQVTGLTVINPNPPAPFGPTAFNFNSTQFLLSWAPAAGAVRYEVYARDTATHTNYVRIVPNIAADAAPRMERLIGSGDLGAFDPAPFSGGFLAGGNRITFAVVGVDAYGARAPLMAAPTVEVRDTIPPTIQAGSPVVIGSTPVDAINDTATAATIRLRITYSEPMDPASMVTYTSNATNMPTAAWAWDSSSAGRAGVLTLTIGANNDATGTFVIRGGRDAAGNDIAQQSDLVGALGGRRELLANGEFQMGTMCGLTSWTPTTLNGGPAPLTISNNGSITGSTSPCAAVLGSLPGGTAGTGRSRIVQDVTLQALTGTNFSYEAGGRYRVVNVINQTNPGATYRMECRVTNPAETMTFNTFFSTTPGGNFNSNFLTMPTQNLTAQAGNQVRILCETENTNMMSPGFGALYLDELFLSLVKPGTL